MKSKLIVGAGAIAVVAVAIFAMTLVTAGIVSAQTPTGATPPAAGSPVYLHGKVSTAGAASIVVTTGKGNITANINSNTYIVVKVNGQATTGTATDLTVGDNVNVVGQATADATVVDAKLIAEGMPFGKRPDFRGNGNGAHANGSKGSRGIHGPMGGGPMALPHGAAGTITAINGDSITLDPNKGATTASVTVNTSANTLVLNNGITTLSTLKVGDSIEVLGAPVRPTPSAGTTPTQTRTINAWGIRVDNGTTKVQAAHVATVSGSTITTNAHPFNNKGGTIINVDSNTQYKTLTITIAAGASTFSFADATQADVQANSNILVEGVASADGTSMTADAVIIMPERAPFVH